MMIHTRDRRVVAILKQKQAAAAWTSPRGPKKCITKAVQDGAWAGQRCFIIGGGPSLLGFDYERLRGERIIAVNRAYEDVPFADILYAMDYQFYRWIIGGDLGQPALERFNNFKGIRLWFDINNVAFGPNVHYVRGFQAAHYGFPAALERGIYGGNNSGYGALQVALLLKANPIYLLGYDFQHAGGRSHSHSGYPRKQSEHSVFGFKQGFIDLARDITAHGFRVVNLNPQSGLRCFEFSTFDEVVNATNSGVKTVEADAASKPGDELTPDHPGPGMPVMRGADVL